MKKIKILLGVFSTTTMFAPIATAISCGPSHESNVEKTETTKDEGFFLKKSEYQNGQIGSGTKDNIKVPWKESTNTWVKINTTSSWDKNKQSVIEFEAGDAFYVKYNKDDSDGFAPMDFLKNVWMEDSSVALTPEVVANNNELGNEAKSGNDPFSGKNKIKFGPNGELNSWVGSTASPKDAKTSIKDLYNSIGKNGFTKPAFDSLAKLYGFNNTPEADGSFNETNNNKASRFTMAIAKMQGKGYFSYKKINERLFKITFNNPNNVPTAGVKWHFGSTKDKNKDLAIGTWALGEKTWGKYEVAVKPGWDAATQQMRTTILPSDYYNFQARKNQFITKL